MKKPVSRKWKNHIQQLSTVKDIYWHTLILTFNHKQRQIKVKLFLINFSLRYFHWHNQLKFSNTLFDETSPSSSVVVKLLHVKLLLLLLLLIFDEQMLLFSTTPFFPEVAIKTFWHFLLESWWPFMLCLILDDERWWSSLLWFFPSLNVFPTLLSTRWILEDEDETKDIGWCPLHDVDVLKR